nr:hypothetical protein [Candidatus Peribacteraceae bacterium]
GALKVIGSITIAGLAEFFGDVHIYGELMLSNRQAGFAVIPKTGTSVTVHWDPPMTGTPVVTATPDTPVLYAVTKVSATGFTIRIAGTADEQIMFSYIALSADAPLTAMGAGKTPVVATPFPVNELGQPVSFDPIWNGCIQGRAVLDADGQPYSCARYREDFTWQHPDLGISFIYNPNHEPPILTLPEGYVVTVIVSSDSTPDNSEPAPESPPDEPVTEPEETPPDDTDTPPDSTTDDTDTPPDSTTNDTESPPDTTSDNTEPATDASPPSSETEPAASGEKSGSSVEAIPVTESADPAPPPTE